MRAETGTFFFGESICWKNKWLNINFWFKHFITIFRLFIFVAKMVQGLLQIISLCFLIALEICFYLLNKCLLKLICSSKNYFPLSLSLSNIFTWMYTCIFCCKLTWRIKWYLGMELNINLALGHKSIFW